VGLEARHRFRLLVAAALAVLACGLSVASPLVVQRLLSRAATNPAVTTLALPAATVFLAAVLNAVAVSINGWLLGAVAIDAGRRLRDALYRRLHSLPMAWFDRTPTGSILSRVMDDVGIVQGLASGPALATLIELATAAGAALWLASQSWRLAASALLLAPLYGLVFWLYVRPIRSETHVVRNRLDEIFSHLKQKLDGMLVVRATGQDAREMADFTRHISDLHQPRMRVADLSIGFFHWCTALTGLGSVLIFAVAASEVVAGRMPAGHLIATTMLAGLALAPLPRLAELAAQVQQARASQARLLEILQLQPCAAIGFEWAGTPGHRHGQVAFLNVDFGYVEGQQVLTNFHLEVPRGQRLAIVGPSGSGKSTLAHLLLRFYEPQRGEIRLDGRPLCDIRSSELRQTIGVVPQDATIFRGTLADNIRYAAPHAGAAEVEAAARGALVHELALRLPQGYDTLVGEGGHPLSLGERQRIAIARVFCKNPALVVLDEATSSLDPASEALVRRALERLLAGRTTITIAHRLETVESADQIVVMDRGRIVQSGTHAELLEDSTGLYRRLHDAQKAVPSPERGPRLPARPSFEPAAA
jgi:subfamily B ATP-binding cassette protein MsbA